MQILETDRLVFREFETDDLEGLLAVLGDPEVMRYSLRGVSSRDGVRKAIAFYRKSYAEWGYGRWAVIERSSDTLLGFCGIGRMSVDGIARSELGYRLRRDRWDRGYGTEAAIACRDHAFGVLGLPGLIAMIEPDNHASIRVAEKAGFRFGFETCYEGVLVRVYEQRNVSAPSRDEQEEPERGE